MKFLDFIKTINKKPKPQEIALFIVLFVVTPFYLIVRPSNSSRTGVESGASLAADTASPSGISQDGSGGEERGGFEPPRPKTVHYTSVRNIFDYPPLRPVRTPPPLRTPPPKKTPKLDDPNNPKVTPTPKLPPIDFKFIGFLGPKDGKIAVLKKEEAIFVGMEGEVIEVKDKEKKVTKYKIFKIGHESIEMGYPEHTGTQKIKLSS